MVYIDLRSTRSALAQVLFVTHREMQEHGRSISLEPYQMMFLGHLFYGIQSGNKVALFVRQDNGQPFRITSKRDYIEHRGDFYLDPQWVRQNAVISALRDVFGTLFAFIEPPVRLYEDDLPGHWPILPIAWAGLLWHTLDTDEHFPKVLTKDGFAMVVTGIWSLIRIWRTHGLVRASRAIGER